MATEDEEWRIFERLKEQHMVNSRNKGAAFEREVANKIANDLGIKVRRNLEQYRSKGHGDLEGWPGVVIECKRYKTATEGALESWWAQTLEEAEQAKAVPVLIYKADRKPIKVLMPLGFVAERFAGMASEHWPLEMDWHTFCAIARERLIITDMTREGSA